MTRGVDYIGVGVGAAIFNTEGKLFITQRGEKAKNERGKWEIPGGSVEFGETFEEAIKREIKEELGIEIEVLELLGICDHIIPEEKQYWVSPTYICRIVNGEPTILEPEKCSAVGWYTVQEIESLQLPLSIVTKYDISLLKKKYRYAVPPQFDPYGLYDAQTFEGSGNEKVLRHFHQLIDKLTNAEVRKIAQKIMQLGFDATKTDRDVLITILEEARFEDFYREYYKIIYSRKHEK